MFPATEVSIINPLSESNYDTEKYQDIIEEKTYYKTKEIKEKYKDIIEEIPVFTGKNVFCNTRLK